MDLVTLVTACALMVDPKFMHALIWHQSGGEPCSFTVPEERQRRSIKKSSTPSVPYTPPTQPTLQSGSG
jgi:hypothetical protein